MAHELTIRADGRAEMAFVGETPWHGLGQSVTKESTIEEWQRAAGMDWEALSGVPAANISAAGAWGGFVRLDFPEHKALWRSDTLEPLAIVGAGYQVVQPRQVLEFFRDMTEQGGWHIHTAGTLRGGRKLWAMASRGEFAAVGPRRRKSGQTDEVAHNLLFATSLDGSMKTTVADTAIRVVCANTLALALRDNNRTIQISHRSVFDEAAVKRALGLVDDAFGRFMRQARELSTVPVAEGEAIPLLRRIFRVDAQKRPSTAWLGGLKDMAERADQEAAGTGMQRVLALFEGAGMGASLPGAAGTRWGLLNAVTEHVDWDMGRTADTRLDSAWFGRGNALKQDALRVLTEDLKESEA